MANPITINAEGAWTYPDAKAVMRDLRSAGVECGEAVGGVWLAFDLEKHGPAVVSIVKAHKGRFCTKTFMEALTMENAERLHRENIVQKLEELWAAS